MKKGTRSFDPLSQSQEGHEVPYKLLSCAIAVTEFGKFRSFIFHLVPSLYPSSANS